MAFPSYSTGTVSIGANATTVVGAGSNWVGVNAVPGDLLVVAGNTVMIQDVTDTLHLVIDAWPYAGVAAGTSYSIKKNSPLRFVGSQAMADVSTLVGALNTSGFYVFVGPTETVPDPSLGNDGQYALQATTGKLWQKEGGVWNFIGIQKGFGLPVPWSAETAYNPFETVSLNGTSYVCNVANTNQIPPNAAFWTVLAAKGDGATVAVGTVTTGAGGGAATVTNSGTPGDAVFDFSIPEGKSYACTSSTSFTIGTGSKAFTTQSGLAWLPGARARISSLAGGGANYMEGVVTAYTGTTLTVNVSKAAGSGTDADWQISLAGDPGSGDLLSTNNLSDLTNKTTALTNLGLSTNPNNLVVNGDVVVFHPLTPTPDNDAGTNIGIGKGAAAALAPIHSTQYVTAVGFDAMMSVTTSDHVTALGALALAAITSGSTDLLAVGVDCMRTMTTGTSCVGIGNHCLGGASTATLSTAVGPSSMIHVSTDSSSTAVGAFSLAGNTTTVLTGQMNVAVGYASLTTLGGSSINDTAVGALALGSLSNGSGNTAVGYRGAVNLTVGHFNTFIGSNIGATLTSGFSNILIGNDTHVADVPTSTTSDHLDIGGVIKGDMTGGGSVKVNGALIDNLGWTAFTPAATVTGGGATAAGRYKTIGKTTFFTVKLTVTAGGSQAFVGLPVAASASAVDTYAAGREVAALGNVYVGSITASATSMSISRYDNSPTVTTGMAIVLSGQYESA
jgi:hypothetical protein